MSESKPTESKQWVALIVGALGITGAALVRRLISDKDFVKIYGTTRRDTLPDQDSASIINNPKVQYITGLDASDAKSTQDKLGEIAREVTHVFVVAWVKRSTEEEMCDVNGRLMKNILDVVSSSEKLKHVILQTGTKYYGVHQHPIKIPAHEDDPRDSGPNFYYVQEDMLMQRAAASKGKWSWNVLRPSDIIGHTGSNYMNLGQTIAVYACLCREQRKPFTFPGAKESWTTRRDASDVDLIARFFIWCCHTSKAHNQAFNVVNGESFKWCDLWPKIAEYFKLAGANEEPKPRKLAEEVKKDTSYQQTWKSLAVKYKLAYDDVNEVATWWFADQVLGWTWDVQSGMDKARKFGWTEPDVDYVDNYYRLFRDLEKDNIIPKLQQ